MTLYLLVVMNIIPGDKILNYSISLEIEQMSRNKRSNKAVLQLILTDSP